MKQTIIISLLFLLKAYVGSSQSSYPTKDSLYTFWQADRRIEKNDYLLARTDSFMYATIALWTVMDLPENVKELSPKHMKFYIAPVCARYLSTVADAGRDLSPDQYPDQHPDQQFLAHDNILFDILELSAREARLKISLLPDSVMTVTELSDAFKKIVKEMHENRLRMNRKFKYDYAKIKMPNAIQIWQKKLKDELDKTSKWSTQPVECYRFLQNKPLEVGYYEDTNSNAILLNKTEQVLGRDTWHAEFTQISRYRK